MTIRDAGTLAMLSVAVGELEAAHQLATAGHVLEAAGRAERAARLLRCVADLERIDAAERERREALQGGRPCS